MNKNRTTCPPRSHQNNTTATNESPPHANPQKHTSLRGSLKDFAKPHNRASFHTSRGALHSSPELPQSSNARCRSRRLNASQTACPKGHVYACVALNSERLPVTFTSLPWSAITTVAVAAPSCVLNLLVSTNHTNAGRNVPPNILEGFGVADPQ